VLREVSALAATGAAIGVVLAWWGVMLMRNLFPSLPRAEQVRMDWRALLFTAAASVIAIAVSGLVPALEALRTDARGGLHQAARPQARGRRRFQRGLVAAQFAISLVLLLGTGLLVRSYLKLSRVDPGFDPSNVITFHVGAEYGEDNRLLGRIQEELMAGIERLPGVQAAGTTSYLPATGATSRRVEYVLEGSSGDSGSGKIPVGVRSVGASYFQALHIPLLRGVTCPEMRADLSMQPKAVVNQRFAEQYGNAAGVIGRHLHTAQQFGPRFNPEIVGVVADQKEDGLNAPAYPYVYTCMWGGGVPDPEYVVRTAGDQRQILTAIRQVVRSIAPSRAVFGVKTMEEHVESSLDTPRLSSQILVVFAGLALLLAGVGLYSLAMLAVTTRTKEIGLRVALGAGPRRIVASVILDAAVPICIGLGAGAALAAVALRAKVVQSALFEVDLTDGVTLLSVAATLAAVAMLAALIPARRAAAIDPIHALRDE
jgi:putative ABC transport system permease protein